MGLVASLARPGGNATGVNLFTPAVEAKKLDLLSKLVPTATTFAFLLNPNNPAAEEKANEMRDAARALDRQLDVVGAGTEAEIDSAFATVFDRRIGALVIMADQYFDDTRRAQLVALAARHAIPTIYGQQEYALDGGLISYGTNLAETRPSGRQLRRPHSQGCEARRSAGAAAHQVRNFHQPQDRKIARVEYAR